MITKEELRVRLEAKRARAMERVPFVAGEISFAEEMTGVMDEGLKKLAIQKDRLERKLIDLDRFDGEVDGLPTIEVLEPSSHLDFMLRYCEPKDKPHAGIVIDKTVEPEDKAPSDQWSLTDDEVDELIREMDSEDLAAMDDGINLG